MSSISCKAYGETLEGTAWHNFCIALIYRAYSTHHSLTRDGLIVSLSLAWPDFPKDSIYSRRDTSLQQLVKSLRQLHERRVVHGDLRKQNMFLVRREGHMEFHVSLSICPSPHDFEVMSIDFGNAQLDADAAELEEDLAHIQRMFKCEDGDLCSASGMRS